MKRYALLILGGTLLTAQAQLPASPTPPAPPASPTNRAVLAAAAAPGSLRARLQSIRLPQLKFRAATLTEVIETIQAQGIAADPKGEGFNLLLRLTPEYMQKNAAQRFTIVLGPMPVEQALQAVASAAQLWIQWDAHAVILRPIERLTDDAPAKSEP